MKLAIIGAGRMAEIFCKNAREMGVETHCFAWDDGAIAKKSADYFYPISIFEKDEILKICRDVKIDGVVATTELTIAIAAYLSNKLELNGLDFEIAKQITDKTRNRKVTSGINGLFHPKFAEITEENEIYDLNLNLPIILKPTDKGGKKGIQVIYSNEDIHEAFCYSFKETSGKGKYIVEEFIEGGTEYSVESLSYQGKNYIIQVTEKISSGAPHCVELGHHQPANISNRVRKEIENVISQALTAIGLTYGPCHTEIKIKDDKIYLIEFNARPGGDHISYPLIHLSTGYPFIKGAIQIALNTFSDVDTTSFSHCYASVYFVTKQTEYLKKIFDTCEDKKWCYMKNYVSDDLKEIKHNDGYNTNFFIYYDKYKKPNFQDEEGSKRE